MRIIFFQSLNSGMTKRFKCSHSCVSQVITYFVKIRQSSSRAIKMFE